MCSRAVTKFCEVTSRPSNIRRQKYLQKHLKSKIGKQLTCRLGWHPNLRRVTTTCLWPRFTPRCNAVWWRLFLAFKSAPPRANISITSFSSPRAAWCIARSPSLSYKIGKCRSLFGGLYWLFVLDPIFSSSWLVLRASVCIPFWFW